MAAVWPLWTAGILATANAVFANGTARSVADSIQALRIANQPHGSREVKDVSGPSPPAGYFDAVSGDQPGGDKGGDGPGRGVFGDPEALCYRAAVLAGSRFVSLVRTAFPLWPCGGQQPERIALRQMTSLTSIQASVTSRGTPSRSRRVGHRPQGVRSPARLPAGVRIFRTATCHLHCHTIQVSSGG